MASKNTPVSTTLDRTYSRRSRSISTINKPPVETTQPKVKKFSAAWWKEVRALGAHRRAVYFGPLTRAGKYQDDSDDEELVRIREMAVPEQHQEASAVQEPALSEPVLAGSTTETKMRELRSKRQADNWPSAPTSTSREVIHNASLKLLATMALDEEENQAEPSEPVTRRKGKEPMVSEDEEESYWEDYVHFFEEQDSEDDVEVPVEPVQQHDTVDEVEEEEEQQLRPTNQPLPKRVTRSALKRQHTATFVEEPAAKRVKKVIVIDSDVLTDDSDSDSKRPEEAEAEEEGVEEAEDDPAGDDGVEEEEFEAADDPQVNAWEVIQYNI